MIWVNVDFPTKVCMLHREDCSRKPKVKPQNKGFGTLEDHGGWLLFPTAEAAEAFYVQTWQPEGFELARCSSCEPA